MRIAALILALALGACAGAVPGNPQGYAGITRVDVSFHEDGSLDSARIWDGKDKQDVRFNINLDARTAVYEARVSTGSKQAQVRAAVESAVSDDARAAMPGIVDSIVQAIAPLL